MAKKRNYTDLIESLFPDGSWEGDNYITFSPLREDATPGGAFTLNRWGYWSDINSPHAKKKGTIIELVTLWKGIKAKEAKQLCLGSHIEDIEYIYTTSNDVPLFVVKRSNYEYGKQITSGYYENDSVIWKEYKEQRPLYRLPDLYNYPSHKVLIVEGEKCVEALNRDSWLEHNWVITTWSGGASRLDATDLSPLYDRDVVLWPDADAASIDAMEQINATLGGGCRIVDVSSFAAGEDLADLVARGDKVSPHIENAKIPESGGNIYANKMPFSKWKHVAGKDTLRPLGTIENFRILMSHYGIRLRENLMSHKTESIFTRSDPGLPDSGKVNNAVNGFITSLAVLNNFPTGNLDPYQVTIAQENAYHPARQMLEHTEWDGVDRLPDVYSLFTTPADYPQDMKELLLRKWLISCVAALYERPYRGRGVLTLQGAQSIGKTSVLASLFPVGFEEGLSLDPRNKDSVEKAISNWVCELGELEGVFKKSDLASLKSFITNQFDTIRFAYERRAENYPRRTVFCATVNEQQFLTDHTGSTRFWVIPVVKVTYNHDIDVLQLWAQVKGIYAAHKIIKQDALWWLTPEEEQRLAAVSLRHTETDEMEELFLDHYDGEVGSLSEEYMSTTQILKACGAARPKRYDINRMSQTLRRLGFEQGRNASGNYRWRIDPTLFTTYVDHGADL